MKSIHIILVLSLTFFVLTLYLNNTQENFDIITPTCPPGFYTAKDASQSCICKQLPPVIPQCTQGFSYDPNTQKCEKVDVCPPGSKLGGGGLCEATPTCPSNAVLNKNGACQPQCPTGFTASNVNDYVVCIALPSCPQGLNVTGNVCESKVVCPPGSSYNSSIQKCELDVSSYVCDTNFELFEKDGKRCCKPKGDPNAQCS